SLSAHPFANQPAPLEMIRASMRVCSAVLIIASGSRAQAQAQRESPLSSARGAHVADSILRLMTLAEKVGQLNQLPGMGTQTGPRAPVGGEALVRSGGVGSFLGIFGADYTRELQRIATHDSRLKMPLLFGLDVIHGF